MQCLRLAGLAALIAAPAFSAAVPSTPPQSFGASIDVRVVNVEAVVTGRKGERVRGLKAGDFRLLVDGKEVPIDYFTEVADGEAVAPAAAAGAVASSPAAAAPVGPGEKVGTNYLVFVDDQFSIAAPRNVVLRHLAADLGRLGPQDRMAIVAFDGHRLARLSDWTADHKALAQAFAVEQQRPASGIARIAERRTEGEDALTGESGGAALIDQVWQTGIGIKAVVAAMRGTPAPAGRKVMILLNGGWGLPDVPERLRGAPSAADLPQDETMFAPIFDTANLLGYTLYAVDVQGLDPQSTWADARATGPVAHGFITSSYERGVHAALEVVARETGGKAVLNSARLDAFARVAADTSSYYWLGFTPQWKADGSHHDIRVEVRQAGLAVRSRTSFSDLSPAEEAQTQAASQLLYSSVTAQPLAVTPGTTRRSSLRTVELPLSVEIPVADLTPLPAEGGWNLAANLSIAVLEGGTESARWRTLPVRIHVAALPAAGGTVHWQTLVKMHRSTRRLLLVLGGDHGEVLRQTEIAVPRPG